MSIRDFPLRYNKNEEKIKAKFQKITIPYLSELFPVSELGLNDSNLRKLKHSCLKNKCPLFEIESLQIGVISSTFFDFASSRTYLRLIVYYGNKTNEKVTEFSVDFSGDDSKRINLN